MATSHWRNPLSLKILDHPQYISYSHVLFFLSNYRRTKLNLAPILLDCCSGVWTASVYRNLTPFQLSRGHCRCLSPLVAPVLRCHAEGRLGPAPLFHPRCGLARLLSHTISISMLDLPCLFFFWKVSPKNVSTT